METPNFSVIVHKDQLNLMGLVHAMQSNGPLPQVSISCCDVLTTLQSPVGYRIDIPIGHGGKLEPHVIGEGYVFEI